VFDGEALVARMLGCPMSRRNLRKARHALRGVRRGASGKGPWAREGKVSGRSTGYARKVGLLCDGNLAKVGR